MGKRMIAGGWIILGVLMMVSLSCSDDNDSKSDCDWICDCMCDGDSSCLEACGSECSQASAACKSCVRGQSCSSLAAQEEPPAVCDEQCK